MIRAALLAAASIVACTASAASPNGGLNAQQAELLKRAYPKAEVIFDCQGNFSGASSDEHVLGIRRAGEPPRRVGLLLDSGKWVFHDIDRELAGNKLPPRHFPQQWEPPPGNAAPKCNADPHRERDMSDRGKTLGERPLFTLRPGQSNACFATSTNYNNWDCVAYRDGRFHLWYQQVFAD